MYQVKREDCNKLTKGSCEGCPIYGEFLEAMRRDAWERTGKPAGLPFDWFTKLYTWGPRAQEVVKKCPPEARPDYPQDGETFDEMMERVGKDLRRYAIK